MKGSCLCGGVVVATDDHHEISVCHCGTCRRWAGGPLLAVHCGTDVEFSGEIAPATYQSSDWGERGFCPACGTSLFFHVLPSNEYILPAGLFDGAVEFHVASQIFIEEKPDYYAFSNVTPTMTGEQVFARFKGDPA